VQSQNYLGIYISKDSATVVCVDSNGKGEKIIGCFSVTAQEQEQPRMQILANLIAQGCAERKLEFSDVAVALDCAMFMQHNIHSEFTDQKQIAATIRFDTEEALATDITDIALTFEIISTDENGSNLNVFTAQRKILSEVLLSLQQHNIDTITIEPDINCLSRFINNKISTDESRQQILFAMLSRRSGYLIIPPAPTGTDSRKSSIVRTFLVGPKQNRTDLLTREVLMTTALAQSQEPINNLRFFDSAGLVDKTTLSEKVGLETANLELFDTAQQPYTDGTDQVDFAIAHGAALTLFEKEHNVNFRDDFSPFQGKKIKTQNSLKVAAVSVTVLLIAVGLYFQTQLFNVNRDMKKIRSKFAQEYLAVTLKKLPDNLSIKQAVRDLGSLQRTIEAQTKGLDTDQTSILSKLTLVLSAFNKCAAQTDLNIKMLSITSQNITITGDTSGRQKSIMFFDQLKESGLAVDRPNYDLKGGRDGFSITVKLTK
jgi:cell division protein FtsL